MDDRHYMYYYYYCSVQNRLWQKLNLRSFTLQVQNGSGRKWRLFQNNMSPFMFLKIIKLVRMA